MKINLEHNRKLAIIKQKYFLKYDRYDFPKQKIS